LRHHPDGDAIMEKTFLEHNHPMLPAKPAFLPRDVESHVKVMARIGVARADVNRFVHEVTGQYLTRDQLAAFFESDRARPGASETKRLIDFMEENGGNAFPWEIDQDGDRVRAGVFTVTAQERNNLQTFGDVLFLDGTAITNELGWTTFPVTLVDDANHIVSGGLLFMAYERAEVYLWLLQLLIDFLGEKLQTVFTDEDIAMLSAMREVHLSHPNVHHRLCVWHKRANFEKRVHAIVRDRTACTVAMELFDAIMYEPRQDKVDQSLAQLRTSLSTLHEYMETEIVSLRHEFTEADRGCVFTLGRR
jgi:hypothetical protein